MTKKPASARHTSASSNQKRSAPAPQHAPAAVAFARAAPDAPAILRMASETIAQRGQARDSGSGQERSMTATVAAFNAIEGATLTERQGWAFMWLLKATRSAASARNGRRDLDSYLDGAAYAALAGECALHAQGAQDEIDCA